MVEWVIEHRISVVLVLSVVLLVLAYDEFMPDFFIEGEFEVNGLRMKFHCKGYRLDAEVLHQILLKYPNAEYRLYRRRWVFFYVKDQC